MVHYYRLLASYPETPLRYRALCRTFQTAPTFNHQTDEELLHFMVVLSLHLQTVVSIKVGGNTKVHWGILYHSRIGRWRGIKYYYRVLCTYSLQNSPNHIPCDLYHEGKVGSKGTLYVPESTRKAAQVSGPAGSNVHSINQFLLPFSSFLCVVSSEFAL